MSDPTTKSGDSGAPDGEPAPVRAPVPDRIDEFRLIARIGQGGFGRVFRAFDEKLERMVAIKIPLLESGYKPFPADQWLAEARAVARLDHPNIIPIHHVGSTPQYPCYLVSKLIDGVNFGEQLKDNRPELRVLIEQVASIAEALEHTHLHDLVHRDVKPGNILVDRQQKAWLTDFGVALSDEQVELEDAKMVVGTVAYMSPEQARGENHRVDARADIYSLGVVLYQAMTGRVPYRGKTVQELLIQFATSEVDPPHHYAADIPIVLERVCLKALMKRPRDRYRTAAEFAADLRWWLQSSSETGQVSVNSLSASIANPSLASTILSEVPKLQPKGLRAFDERDREFFLNLLPGTRTRDGLPESILEWKTRIESRDETQSFSVGLVYGPSGSGKSSFIRAGLIPQLSRSYVTTIYVEATAMETESRLLAAIHRVRPNLPQGWDLPRAMAAIRCQPSSQNDVANDAITKARSETVSDSKILIVIDQFEQWLQSHGGDENSQLVRALRQCDGIHIQAIVLARDDFWMPVTRFFTDLDVRLEEGVNSRPVDRFDRSHARRILLEYGRAYKRLPDPPAELTDLQNEFLDTVIEGLQEAAKVVCIRVVLFAQMMRLRDWTPVSLRDAGGPAGIVNGFLQDTFSDSSASPLYRKLEAPARAILQALLPDAGSPLKGRMRTVSDLQQVSRLNAADFADVIRVLDRELRLITPTAPVTTDSPQDATSPSEPARWYQLTHDFLVDSLREWLFQKQRETRRGRARLQLAELAQLWRSRPETRFLPSPWEFLSIRMLTRRAERNDVEQQFLKRASHHHLVRGLSWMACIMMIGAFVAWVAYEVNLDRNQERADANVARLLETPITDVPKLVGDVRRFGRLANSALLRVANNTDENAARRLRAQIALLPDDPGLSGPLTDKLLTTDAEHVVVIRNALIPFSPTVRERLWSVLNTLEADDGQVVRAAAALAVVEPESPQWNRVSSRIAGALLREESLLSASWSRELRPIRQSLVSQVKSTFTSTAADAELRDRAARILADYASDDAACLAELCQSAMPAQFNVLSRGFEGCRDALVPELHRKLADSLAMDVRSLDNETHRVGGDLARKIEKSHGLLSGKFGFCLDLPFDEFQHLSDRLSLHGYQVVIARPWCEFDKLRIAAIWHRTEQQTHCTLEMTPAEFQQHAEFQRRAGLVPADICVYDRLGNALTDGQRIAAIWRQPLEEERDVENVEFYVLVPEHQHMGHWQPLNDRGFVPRTNQITDGPEGRFYTSLRVRLNSPPAYVDKWDAERRHFVECRNSGWRQVDVRLAKGEDAQKAQCSAVWWNSGPDESEMLDPMTLDEHRDQCLKMIEKGFRPASLSVAQTAKNKPHMATSVWNRRPMTTAELDATAIRAVNVAIALLQLGDTEPARQLILNRAEPSFQAHLIDRFASLKTTPQQLVPWLLSEKDPTVCLSLLLATARYHRDSVPGLLRDKVTTFARSQLVASKSSGVHAACRFLLQSWNVPEIDAVLKKIPQRAEPAPDSEWFVNGQGLAMVVIDPPLSFRMGSPSSEVERSAIEEVPHRRQVSRPFAIAMHEVSAGQFEKSGLEVVCAPNFTPSKQCPMNMVTWYDAARYCRWLSEQEGFAEEEMCFPRNAEIKEGMKLPENLLLKSGYRLPTEAEWELACRSGTLTSRHFGESSTLGNRYGWHADNSGFVLHPIGKLLPNNRGLFDMYGNAMEWTISTRPASPRTLTDLLNDNFDGVRDVSGDCIFVTRGGAFLYAPSNGRSAQRNYSTPSRKHPHLGFRLARTLLIRKQPE